MAMVLACRVLIADDDTAIASVVRRFFERRGATCVMANDGESAATLLRSEPFDVAVLDVTMPRGGGYELLPVARESQPTARVILMSGHPERVAGVEADAYLEKPFSGKALEAILAKWQLAAA